MENIKITLVKSLIARKPAQIATAKSFGFKRPGDFVVVANNEATLNGVADTTVVNFSINNTNWELLTDKTGANGGQLYVYKPTAEQKVTDNNYAVKSGVTLSGVEILTGNKVTISDYTDADNVTVQPTISFYGYAVQSLYSTGVDTTDVVDSAETAYAAWDASWDPAP